MRRKAAALVIVALALPLVALAAMIGQQEWLRSRVTVLNVPVHGVDPRDLLRGVLFIQASHDQRPQLTGVEFAGPASHTRAPRVVMRDTSVIPPLS